MAADILVGWLEQPDAYRWVRLETMDGSLDDIQAERSDGTRRILQVKWGVDPTAAWEWDELTRQKSGKTGLRPSLLQKWKTSIDMELARGVIVGDAALLTNRIASATIRAHLSDSGLVDFGGLSSSLQSALSEQLGGRSAASEFFASFHFFFSERSVEVLGAALQQRFRRLGGTADGWQSLVERIEHWINRKDEPPPDGKITLLDLRAAALWHLPPQIPQGFVVPEDYVAPTAWSNGTVEPRLRREAERVVVVTGSPGAGKSTYLSWLVNRLRADDIPVVRHHYFLSTSDATPHRTAWETAADAITGQLRAGYAHLLHAVDAQNPRPDQLREILTAAGRERADMNPLVVIVDGLDHVWRDTGKEEELRRLFDLLLPVPDGVVLVVGTQDIDESRIPHKLRDRCPRPGWLWIPVLERAGVHEWLHHHKSELELPDNSEHAAQIVGELGGAFFEVSGGHPLILHYAWAAARQGGQSVRPEQVHALPAFAPNSNVASYYRALWNCIGQEGHLLLHLLAGFSWVWPPDGLVQCLAPQSDLVLLEKAETAIRHVLGSSRAGVTAFHESLLAYIRALPEHQTRVRSLRSRVIGWLSQSAPEYWRWRHEWEERARNGEPEPLVSLVTLDWCIDSLVAGRRTVEIGEVVAASGWASLRAGRIGVTTERAYLYYYLNNARDAEGVLSRLTWLALQSSDSRSRDLGLDLLLSEKGRAIEGELEAAAEVAFAAGNKSTCRELLRECRERWDAEVRCADRNRDASYSLRQSLPSLIAASLEDPSDGLYQSYLAKHESWPEWCSREQYVKALARLCGVGDDTRAAREELRRVANGAGWVCFEAVDEIVRLAWRDGFDPGTWLDESGARRSGLFRCDRLWVRHSMEVLSEATLEVSFRGVWPRYDHSESEIVELASTYFFACMASAAEGRGPAVVSGLDIKASKVSTFLSELRDLASEAVAARKAGRTLGGAWLVARLETMDPPQVKPNDYDNHLVRSEALARLVVAIAHDLEGLHVAETGVPTLTRDVLSRALNGPWTQARDWIRDRVDRRLTMGDPLAARLLIDRERARLEKRRGDLHTRAEEYAILAQFSFLHHGRPEEVRELARLAARNLMGHGFHKDPVLFDILAAMRAFPKASSESSLARLQSLSPILQIIDDITDGGGTDRVCEFVETTWTLIPASVPPFLRRLQHTHHHLMVEKCFTRLAKSAALRTGYEKALATTLVHEEALSALQERARSADSEAASALASILTYCGREAETLTKEDERTDRPVTGNEKPPPPLDDYPPDRLLEFARSNRHVPMFGGNELGAWITHWRSVDPDGLLVALTAYRTA